MLPVSEPYQSAMQHPLAIHPQNLDLEQRDSGLSELDGSIVYPRHTVNDLLGDMAGARRTTRTMGTRRTTRDYLPSGQWTFLRESVAMDVIER